MKETRTIEITMEQAAEWCLYGDYTLKELALKAYTLDEIRNSFEYILLKAQGNTKLMEVPAKYYKELEVLRNLIIVAKHLNNGWEKTQDNTGYFLDWDKNKKTVEIYCHCSNVYAGIIYFKSEKAARRAAEILGMDVLIRKN